MSSKNGGTAGKGQAPTTAAASTDVAAAPRHLLPKLSEARLRVCVCVAVYSSIAAVGVAVVLLLVVSGRCVVV
jgi:hypothetical protein